MVFVATLRRLGNGAGRIETGYTGVQTTAALSKAHLGISTTTKDVLCAGGAVTIKDVTSTKYPPAANQRLRRPTQSQFLPYNEAREYMRTVQLSCFTEWEKWAVNSRPSFIPRVPSRIYKNSGWISYPDFCCYEKKPPRMMFREDFDKVVQHDQSLRNLGAQNLKEYIDKCTTDLECEYVPAKLGINLLVRHRTLSTTNNGEKGWRALRVTLEHKFRELRFSKRDCLPGVLPALARRTVDEFTLGYPENEAKYTITISHSIFEKMSDSFISDLQAVCCNRTELKPRGNWMVLGAMGNPPTGAHVKDMMAVDEKFYSPCGVHSSFPSYLELRDQRFNCYVDGIPTIQRKCPLHPDRTVYAMPFFREAGKGRERTWYRAEDAFELCVGTIYDIDNEELIGVFMLPKSILTTYMEVDGRPGKVVVHLYPPFMDVKRETAKAQQKYFSQYYIPLDGSMSVAEKKRKLQEILETVKHKKT